MNPIVILGLVVIGFMIFPFLKGTSHTTASDEKGFDFSRLFSSKSSNKKTKRSSKARRYSC
jgi:hypothetical protein